MTLQEFLDTNKISQAAFAQKLKVSQSHISRLCKGAEPSFAIARRIMKATKGEVTPNDFLSDLQEATE